MNTPVLATIDRALKISGKESAHLLAQIIAFAPVVFHVALSLRDFKLLQLLLDNEKVGQDFQQLQDCSQLSEYSLSVLLDAALSSAILDERDGKYFLTDTGRYLAADKLTQVNLDFTKDVCYRGLEHLTEALKSNKPEGLKELKSTKRQLTADDTIYEHLTTLEPQTQKSWFAFDHFYSDDSFPRVIPMLLKNKPQKILDIGGNTGKFATYCLQKSPDVQVGIVDHPQQLEVAKEHFKKLGLSERVQLFPMNLLNHNEDLPKGYDVIWMSQFLDCFSKEDVLQLLTRAQKAMTDTGTLYILETFNDRQKYTTTKFCLDMTSLYFTTMANGKSRMYPYEQFLPLILDAGLTVKSEVHGIRYGHSLIGCTKRW